MSVATTAKPTPPNVRKSNLELFRIITMLLIVAHHYVVNSGLYDTITARGAASVSDIFLLLFGAWGKTGINCFVLITGYFMCKSSITGKKYFKLIFEVMLYKIVIYLIFLFTGYESISLSSLLNTFLPTTSVATGFTDCFLIFYLLIPFLNILIKNLDKKKHLTLTAILLFAYTIMGVVPWFTVNLNYVSWFCVLYLIAAFIRIYPMPVFDKNKIWGLALLGFVVLSALSVVIITYFGSYIVIIASDTPYYFLSDSNKPFALCTAVSAFMFFKNLNIPYSKFINAVGATTYGVLLIHSSSEAMRQWLWYDTLNAPEFAATKWVYLHAFLSVIVVFTVCSLIDFLRIKFIEAPTLKLFDKVASKKQQKT